MKISYIDSFTAAWNRMSKILFKPFDLSKWMVLGFSAFLAALMSGYPGLSNPGISRGNMGWINPEKILEFPAVAREWLKSNPVWASLILAGIIFFLAIIIILTWIDSRGKFIFLDNITNNRAIIVKPWHDYKTSGNSLFLWRIYFGLICLIVIIPYLVFGYSSVYKSYFSGGWPEMLSVLIGNVLIFLLIIIIISYVNMFLMDFVVPIMHKYNMKPMNAWIKFLGIFKKHFFHFLIYGAVKLILIIISGIFIILAGLLTCCIGYLLFLIPYIGSVALLPVSVTLRAFSLEFLEQFGDDFKMFPDDAEQTEKIS
jgi:hypothetical protein